MRVLPIAEISVLGKGECVPSVKGKVIKIDKYFFGDNATGAWSIQRVTIADDQHQIAVKVGNKPELPKSYVGRSLWFVSNEGEKGLSGCYADDDDGGGKHAMERIVRTTKTCEIFDVETGEPVFAPAAASTPAPAKPPPSRPPPNPAPAPRRAPGAPAAPKTMPPPSARPAPPAPTTATAQPVKRKDITEFLNQHGNLYLYALQVASTVQKQFEATHGQGVMSEDAFRACTSSLFIKLCDAGYAADMSPTGLI